MRPLQIIADPPKIRRQVQVVHPVGVTNPELTKEIEEEVDDIKALPFPRWKYQEMIIDPIIIICWLKYIFEPACCKFENNILYLWSPCKEVMENLYKDKNINRFEDNRRVPRWL